MQDLNNLAISMRPKTYDEICGNNIVKRTLQRYSSDKSYPHAMLFSGAVGCGKTTLARIIAADLGCPESAIYERDTADYRGIDDIRDIITLVHQVSIEPVRVFILDECHKLTEPAQNALLKLLEEAPKDIYLILCTSEPTKLITAVLSRLTKFQVNPLSPLDARALAFDVVMQLDHDFDDVTLDKICEASKYRPRDIIKNTETLVKTYKSVPEYDIEEGIRQFGMLEGGEDDLVIQLIRELYRHDTQYTNEIANLLKDIKAKGIEAELIRRQILAYGASIKRSNPNNIAVMMIAEQFFTSYWNQPFAVLEINVAQAFYFKNMKR